MKKSLLVTISVLVIAFVLSCKKKKEPAYFYKNPPASLDKLYSDNAVKSTKVTVNANGNASVTAPNGSRFEFQANSFMTQGGVSISGNVEIEVADYLKRSDMIFSKLLPVSYNMPLISGGEVYVTASQNGQQLVLKPGRTITVNVPQFGTPVADMELFVGLPLEANSQNNVNWREFMTDSLKPGGLIYNGDTIRIFSSELGLLNIDKIYKNPDFQSVVVNITGVDITPTTPVSVYGIIGSAKSAYPLGWLGTVTTNIKFLTKVPVHLIGFGIFNGEFYSGIVSTTLTAGGSYTITLSKSDAATFKTTVDALP